MRDQLVYLAIRSAPTTGDSGLTDLRPEWWITGDDVTVGDVVSAVQNLAAIGWLDVDVETGELFLLRMIAEEAQFRDGDAIERIARQAEAARSEVFRLAIAAELREINQARAQVAADYLELGLPLPDRGRVSLIPKHELAGLRTAFANCPERLALRGEIDAGLHVCATCGVGPESAFLQVDHAISLARGGKNERANYQVLCSDCNGIKWARV